MDEKTTTKVDTDLAIIFELNRKLSETTQMSLGEIAKRNNEIERKLLEISTEITVIAYTPMAHRFGTTSDGTRWIAFYNTMGLSRVNVLL